MLIKQYDYYPVYYYTLEDILSFGDSEYSRTYTELVNLWKSIVNDEEGDYYQVTEGIFDDGTNNIVNNFVTSYLLPKASEIYVDLLDDGEEMTDYDRNYFLRRLGLFMNETANRYSYLIQAFQNSQSKLLDAVKTVTDSTTKGIDVPQDINIPDTSSTAAANHINSLADAHTETSSDLGTLMSRLKEVKDNLENIYNLWLRDFQREFVIITGGD